MVPRVHDLRQYVAGLVVHFVRIVVKFIDGMLTSWVYDDFKRLEELDPVLD